MTDMECKFKAAEMAAKMFREHPRIDEYVDIFVYMVAVIFSFYMGYRVGTQPAEKK